MALVDSGADTCLLGPEFYIESQSTDRFIVMMGFSGAESRVTGLPFGVSIAVIEVPQGLLMVRVNEGVVVPYQSILAANQLRNFNTTVNDCPRMHGGAQNIILPNSPTLPLQYIGGLVYLPMRKPTPEELATLPIIDITCSVSWNPKMDQTDLNDPPMIMKLQVYEYMETTGDDAWNFKTSTFPTFDMEQVQRCLGLKSPDVIKATLENTTQLAQNHVRLPMKQHFQSQCPALHLASQAFENEQRILNF